MLKFLLRIIFISACVTILVYYYQPVNLFDKKAPRLFDAPDFSFDTRVHDPRGRLLHLIIEYNF